MGEYVQTYTVCPGQAWVDDVILEAVGRRVRRTSKYAQLDGPSPAPHDLATLGKHPLEPEHPDFEH